MNFSLTKEINLFFAYSFRGDDYYHRSDIISVIEDACEIASSDTMRLKNKIKVKPDFYLKDFGSVLLFEIENRIKESKICIIDITDNNPNVFFELGLAKAYQNEIILLKNKKSIRDFEVPSDIKAIHLLYYDDIKEITGRISQRIVDAAKSITLLDDDILNVARNTWNFGKKEIPISINIVTASSETESVFRSFEHPDHIYLDNLCDKDSILELCVMLSKLYPLSDIKIFSTEHFQPSFYEEDIILIGGPGTSECLNNEVARIFLDNLKIPISYDDSALVYSDKRYEAIVNNKNLLTKDFAYFGKFINPFNALKKVFFLQGIHTLGVLGAVKSFALNPTAIYNHKILDNQKPDDEIGLIFPINIVSGKTMPTLIKDDFTLK